jgi:hypothetical protein
MPELLVGSFLEKRMGCAGSKLRSELFAVLARNYWQKAISFPRKNKSGRNSNERRKLRMER